MTVSHLDSASPDGLAIGCGSPVLSEILVATRELTGLRAAFLLRREDADWVVAGVNDGIDLGLQTGQAWTEQELNGTVCAPPAQPLRWFSDDPDIVLPERFGSAGLQVGFTIAVHARDGSLAGVLCAVDTDAERAMPLAGPLEGALRALTNVFSASIETGSAVAASQGGNEPRPQANTGSAVASDALRTAQAKLLSVMSHDLRNPMHTLMAAIEMLQLKNVDPKAGRLLGMIEGSASRLGELAQQSVDFIRLMLLSDIPLHPVPDHAPQLTLQTVIAQVNQAYPQREIALRIDAPGTITADPAKFEQVLSVLLVHAVKHCGANQDVEVHGRWQAGIFECDIIVPGYIVEPHLVPDLFNPFAIENGEPVMAQMGVGLYVAHQIVIAHGGTLGATLQGDTGRFALSMPK